MEPTAPHRLWHNPGHSAAAAQPETLGEQPYVDALINKTIAEESKVLGADIGSGLETTKPAAADARSARVEGVVGIRVTILADGRVTDMAVVRSVPLFDAAALHAVHRCQTRTTLDGNPSTAASRLIPRG